MLPPGRSAKLRVALLVGLAFGAGLAAVSLRPDPGAVATWWPAAGLCAGAVALSPRRWWPVVGLATAVVTFAANGLGGRPNDVGAGLGLANAAEALVVGVVLHRLHRGGPVLLRDPVDFLRLLVASLAGAVTLAAGATATTVTLGLPVWETVRTVAPSHLAAQLVILPVLLTTGAWVTAASARQRRPELVAQAAVLAAVVGVGLWLPTTVSLLVLPMPVLVWAALRFPPRVVALEVLAVAIVTTWATAYGLGPLAVSRGRESTDLVAGSDGQLLLIALALLCLPTALASAQRAQLVRHLDTERRLSGTTLATTAAIIFVTDGDGTVLQVNDSFQRLTGFRPEDVVGRPFWATALIPPERTALVREMFSAPDGSAVPAMREADVMHSNGERLRVVWNNNVVLDDDGLVQHVVCTAADVTSERTSHLLVQHLFEAPLAAPMLFIDAGLGVTLVNRACEELLGTTAGDLVGRSARELMCPDQRDLFVADLEASARASEQPSSTTPVPRDWTWHRPDDGRVLTVSATVSAVHDVVGKRVGYLLVARDATATRASQDALVRALDAERHAVERLRQVDTVKNEFVSTVSHELRTPTTSIVGYTELLREGAAGELNPEQRDILAVVARNGRRLIDVANDLLTLAGLEAGDRTTWDAVPVDLVTVVEAGREAIGPLLGDRELDLDFDLPREPVVVRGDAGHLDRVVMNLLSNAVKFTPDQGRVAVRLRHEAGGGAVLEVADTGIGIPFEEQADLFTKFFRSSTAQRRAIPGTGLGLSIIHNIVTAHDGTIEVRSDHQQGSTFTVRLPLADEPQGAPDAPTQADPLPQQRTGPQQVTRGG